MKVKKDFNNLEQLNVEISLLENEIIKLKKEKSDEFNKLFLKDVIHYRDVSKNTFLKERKLAYSAGVGDEFCTHFKKWWNLDKDSVIEIESFSKNKVTVKNFITINGLYYSAILSVNELNLSDGEISKNIRLYSRHIIDELVKEKEKKQKEKESTIF